MRRLWHSIRFRLALGTLVTVAAFGAAVGLTSFFWVQRSLEEQTRAFAHHEAQELSNVVAGLKSRAEVLAQEKSLNLLMPEDAVVALSVWSLDGELVYLLPKDDLVYAKPWAEGFAEARHGGYPERSLQVEGGPRALQVASLVSYRREPRWFVLATVSRDLMEGTLLDRYGFWYSRGLLIAMVLASLGSFLLLSRALKPVKTLVQDATVLAAVPGGRLTPPASGSELAELTVLLNSMLAKTEATVEALRHFTAHAGHELRTPLTRMRGEAEVALSSADPNQAREALSSILEELDGLRRVIDALHTLAQGEEPDLREEAPFPLEPLVTEIATEANLLGEARGVTVVGVVDAEPAIRGDRVLIARALWNLVDNAIKYSGQGGRIRLRLRETAESVLVEVEDEGVGFNGQDPEELFRPFVRGDPAPCGETGQGLGLALSRAIARRHGGDVTANQTEQGARFVFSLPAEPAAKRQDQPVLG